MIHEQLDLQHWKHVCSLQRLREASGGKSPAGGAITGPCDIAALEQLRDLSYAHLPDLKRVPTDIFIWSFGETDQRMVTKIGGLPYRAANKPWPLSPSGIPLTFVAQICFADSHDLVPELPGDILLIFTEARKKPAQVMLDSGGQYLPEEKKSCLEHMNLACTPKKL